MEKLRQRIASLEKADIERKRAEESLRKSKEQYRLLAENISDVIWTMDMNLQFTYISPSVTRQRGYSVEEAMALGMGKSLTPSSIETATKVLLEGLAAEKTEPKALSRSWTVELEMYCKDGSTIWTEMETTFLRAPDGQPVGILGVARDITERKQAEEELRKYREHLEELVEARTKELQDAQERLVRTEKLAVIGQLAGGVSHELRNPLGAIKNASYFLNMVIEEPDADVKETLEILDKEVATSERIIGSLLEFARPKVATLQKVHINEVIEESLCRVIVPGNIEVVRQLDDQLPIIQTDPGQLGQVFTNIILNAIQAMPEGGQLVVKSEVASPEWATVSFTDSGVGIAEENMGKLFEPLFTTKAKGIGLGLAITRNMLEENSGTIEVKSEVGKGSTFTISLPIVEKGE